MKSKLLSWLGLLAALLVLAWPAQAEPVAPRVAPTWTLPDLDGNPVSFSQFKGKVVVVDFWATWCAPCRVEIPGYIALQDKYGKDGLVIIGISLDRIAPERVKKFAEQNGINYIVVRGDGETLSAFGDVAVLPTTYLIDREGNIRHRKAGAEDAATYEKVVRAYLN